MDEGTREQIIHEMNEQLRSAEGMTFSDIAKKDVAKMGCAELYVFKDILPNPAEYLQWFQRGDFKNVPGMIGRSIQDVSEATRLTVQPLINARIAKKQCDGPPVG